MCIPWFLIQSTHTIRKIVTKARTTHKKQHGKPETRIKKSIKFCDFSGCVICCCCRRRFRSLVLFEFLCDFDCFACCHVAFLQICGFGNIFSFHRSKSSRGDSEFFLLLFRASQMFPTESISINRIRWFQINNSCEMRQFFFCYLSLSLALGTTIYSFHCVDSWRIPIHATKIARLKCGIILGFGCLLLFFSPLVKSYAYISFANTQLYSLLLSRCNDLLWQHYNTKGWRKKRIAFADCNCCYYPENTGIQPLVIFKRSFIHSKCLIRQPRSMLVDWACLYILLHSHLNSGENCFLE